MSEKLSGVALRDVIVRTRASFAESDWGVAANTEAKRLACVVRLLEVLAVGNDMTFDAAEAATIVDELLSR